VALAALEKLLAKGTIKKDEKVVVISTAHGLKFIDFKVKYHESAFKEFTSQMPNPPMDVPAKYEKVRDAVLSEIDKRFSG
jgi:threonine synthase